MSKPADLNFVRTGPLGDVPIVLLHSAGLDLTYWDAQIAALSRNHDVIAVDLPGHGLSEAEAESITMPQVARAVSSTIASLGAGPVHLVGLSVGGLIAQELAITEPDLIRSLTLIDTAARFAPAGQAAMKARADLVREQGVPAILDALFGHWFLAETCERRPDLVDRATKTLVHDDTAVHAALWEMIANFDAVDRLGSITAETLVLVGRYDSSSPISSSEELRDGIAHAHLQVIENAAHLSPIEQPDDVTSRLEAFLQSLAPVEAI